MTEQEPVITPSYKPSYWHNPGTEPLSPLTVGQLVDIAADKWGDRTSLISLYQGHRFTFAEVREKADQLAAGLVQLGLQKGDRMAIWGPNSSQWFISRIAAARAGLIAVLIDPSYQPPQLAYSLNKVETKALICPGDSFYQRVQAIVPELGSCPESGVELMCAKIPSLKTIVTTSDKQYRGAYRYEDVITSARPETVRQVKDLQTEIQPDEGTSIQFSSGTTGFPKAALMSHINQVNNAYYIGKRIREEEESESTLVLPVLFCHTSGSVGGILSNLKFGVTIVLPAPTFDIKKTLDAIIEFGADMTFATPSLFVDMLELVQKHNMKFTTLDIVGYGGAPCSQQLAMDMKRVLNITRLTPLYGMTETGINFFGRHEDTLEQMTSKVGYVMPQTEVKVVDKDGKMVPIGTPGELWVRSYSVMKGYWGEEEKTRQFRDDDGWAKTGAFNYRDLFILEEDGYGKIVGRLKDVIIRIGDKIFPVEMEEFFQEHPDIMEAQVFGVPDTRVGEEICVYLRMKEGVTFTEQDVINYCKGKIADYRIPRYIRFAKDFPRSGIGKVIKSKLLDIVKQEIGMSNISTAT
ncbi:hypothetical protein ANN_18349 [Periplaneta americana]|uniref:Medium-chain acyl-CoA ligase ACSF2, mitochondrial n=1 Tax=Periplaneta americana TaxID=6978 RepID=A0ABQ8SNI2_PERAM|nr:hypothetical protein ANN_18349 [Periplaneta americana]